MQSYADIPSAQRICAAKGWGYTATGEPVSLTEEQFFEVSKLLGNFDENPAYRSLFEHLAGWIVSELAPQTTLELGCGPGYLLYCLNRLGRLARGVDGNSLFCQRFRQLQPSLKELYILDAFFEQPLQPADAFIAIEVFEHIPDEDLHRIMLRVKRELRPRHIVFSSTPYADANPGWDIQWGHINLKNGKEWEAFFKGFDYRLDPRRPPVTEWAQLYTSESD